MMSTDSADKVDDVTKRAADITSKSCPSTLSSESAAGEINVAFVQDFPQGTAPCESVGKKDAAAGDENGKENKEPSNHQSRNNPGESLFGLKD